MNKVWHFPPLLMQITIIRKAGLEEFLIERLEKFASLEVRQVLVMIHEKLVLFLSCIRKLAEVVSKMDKATTNMFHALNTLKLG